MELEEKMRIVQELVPGKQITLAHIIANPDESFYAAAGLEAVRGGAIGIVNTSPAEFALIAGDIGVKASGVKISHIDYHRQRNAYNDGSGERGAVCAFGYYGLLPR